MIRQQAWEPDTHDARFITEWDDTDPDAPHVCIEAWIGGQKQADPQGAYDAVLTQNQTKNVAIAAVIEALPPEMKKPILDSDGDPTGEFTVKDKHAPRWSLNEKGQVSISVPGAKADLVAALDAAIPMAAVIAHEG